MQAQMDEDGTPTRGVATGLFGRSDTMPLDIELYHRTIYVPVGRDKKKLRRISVVDMQPEDAKLTLVMVHGYGGSAAQWLYQLQLFGQKMRVVAPDMRGH